MDYSQNFERRCNENYFQKYSAAWEYDSRVHVIGNEILTGDMTALIIYIIQHMSQLLYYCLPLKLWCSGMNIVLKLLFLQGWKLYDSGPKSVKVPLVCLPPVSGTAEVFFKQILALSAKGIRVIAVRNHHNINLSK